MPSHLKHRLNVQRPGLLVAVTAVAVISLTSPFARSQRAPATELRFEVASIKLSNPGQDEIRIDVEGRHFNTRNTTLLYLVQFAYGFHAGQVVGGPQGRDSQRYDIAAEADAQTENQGVDTWKPMLQKLLEDRFKLRVHHEQRERSVFAVVVAKSGQKLTKNAASPDGHADFSHSDGKGRVVAQNATMADFAGMLQDFVFRDQSVVDHTHLVGRFDFTLAFTPDQAEYRGRYSNLPLSDDSPPSFYTAIQEQLGLKLESAKVPVDVLVIDQFERPSDN
jgi:uncharacterized protein (TIGR03435 family)